MKFFAGIHGSQWMYPCLLIFLQTITQLMVVSRYMYAEMTSASDNSH